MCLLPKRQGFPLLPVPQWAPHVMAHTGTLLGLLTWSHLYTACASGPLCRMRGYEVKEEGQTCYQEIYAKSEKPMAYATNWEQKLLKWEKEI